MTFIRLRASPSVTSRHAIPLNSTDRVLKDNYEYLIILPIHMGGECAFLLQLRHTHDQRIRVSLDAAHPVR